MAVVLLEYSAGTHGSSRARCTARTAQRKKTMNSGSLITDDSTVMSVFVRPPHTADARAIRSRVADGNPTESAKPMCARRRTLTAAIRTFNIRAALVALSVH